MAKETINIYLEKKDQEKIDKLKVKYQLSLTTIVDILVYVTLNNIDNISLEELKKDYIYKKGKKTSIKKPRIFKTMKMENLKENRFCTNVLLMYLNKDAKKYIPGEKLSKYYNMVTNKMEKTEDQFWNYNQHIRWQRRMLKENKNYFRKAIENV